MEEKRESTGETNTLMYTPIKVGNVSIAKCLVDLGSEVNVMLIKAATKYGLSYSPVGVRTIQGFDGHEGAIVGSMVCNLSFGPDSKTRRAEFLVSPSVSYPILGCPTLREFGLSVNCENRELCDNRKKKVVRCSAIYKQPKN